MIPPVAAAPQLGAATSGRPDPLAQVASRGAGPARLSMVYCL